MIMNRRRKIWRIDNTFNTLRIMNTNTNTNTNTKRTTEQLREWREVELEALWDWATADGYADERGAIAILGDAEQASTLLYGDGERLVFHLASAMITNEGLAELVTNACQVYRLLTPEEKAQMREKMSVAGEGEGDE